MKKIILFLCLLFFGLLPINMVIADGGMIPYYQGTYRDIYEPSQTALIVYREGREDLYLKVNYQGETNNFVWLIPTPSFPKAAKAPKDIFEELSVITSNETKSPGVDGRANALGQASSGGVMVHSQEQIGIYQITVLSATGVNGLFDWLNSHGYKISQEVKAVLDWYVKKEWYFTAVKINPGEKLAAGVEVFKKFDQTVTENNFIEKFADYFILAVKDGDYEKFKNALTVFKVILSEKDYSSLGEVTDRAKFEEFRENEGIDDYSQEKWAEAREEIQSGLRDFLKVSAPETINKYDDYIEPVKISFAVSTMVYPLKISQISTRVPTEANESVKTNEILLYILSARQAIAPGFKNEYAETINTAKLDEISRDRFSPNLTGLKQIVNNETYVLTKLRRDFAREEMDEDVYLINGDSSGSVTGENQEPLMAFYQANQAYLLAKNKVKGSALADRLKGKIVIKVEDNGKAYYINPATKYYHYLGRPSDAFNVMKEQGVGVTDNDLAKIQIGLASLSGADQDGDGLSDIFEEAIGTDKNTGDSDGDGFSDKAELENGYNPLGAGKKIINKNFSQLQQGRILLQVEHLGEAWYINPADGRRYFLGRPQDAFTIMKMLGLGITNNDFENL